jgi:type VI protein secretion system component Hcp
MTLKLVDALVTSYSLSGSGHGDERPTEAWTINAARVEWEYTEARKTAD